MAILKGIKVTIVVNGQDLHEYHDEDAGSNTRGSVSRYIEATSGAEFQIKSSAPKSHKFTSEAVRMGICLDGIEVDSGLFLKPSAKPKHAWNAVFSGARRFGKTGWECRPFMFAELLPVEDASSGPIRPRIADLGTVTITCTRNKVLGSSNYKSIGAPVELPDAPKLAEKELKGMSVTHVARFQSPVTLRQTKAYSLPFRLGEVQTCEVSTSYRSAPVNSKEPPIAIFKFNYRSRIIEALQGLLLIPRTPSPPRSLTPVPLEERPIDDLAPEEMRELLRRQKASQRTGNEGNIKNKSGVKPDADATANRSVKRERDQEYDNILASASEKKARTRPFTNGEIVELDD